MARGVTVGAGTGTRDDGRIRAGMLLLWGVAATVRNLLAGRQLDRFERSGGDHAVVQIRMKCRLIAQRGRPTDPAALLSKQAVVA